MPTSAPGKLTRQQIYDRVRETSKDEYILEEMIRLGFWNEDEEKPSLPETHLKRQGELERQLREIVRQQGIIEDPEKALQAMRKQRMAESRKKREENKIKRVEAAHAKAVAWQEQQKTTIFHLGDGVSAGLNDLSSDSVKLASQGLPILNDAASIATAMGISLPELRFLAYSRKTSTVSHYKRFEMVKKSGGTRLISAPMPRLKRAQYWILDNILNELPVSDKAHGFVPSRSILSNAKPHLKCELLINLDLKDFFPTITYPRIKGIFKTFGYSEQVATILGLLCSEPHMDEVILDDTTYFVGNEKRFLPQGAPTSPAITNIICRKLDNRLSGISRQLGYTYTRYADDLSFSLHENRIENITALLWRIKQIVIDEGFIINTKKTRIIRSGSKMEVTGIVVNDKLSVDRKTLRRFRALLFQIEKDGPEGKKWGTGNDLMASITGYAHFVKMVDPQKGQRFLDQINAIKAKANYKADKRVTAPLSKKDFREKAKNGEVPRSDWWQVKEKEPPKLILPKRKYTAESSASPVDDERPTTPPPLPGKPSLLKALLYTLAKRRWIFFILIFLIALRFAPIIAILVLPLIIIDMAKIEEE